MIRLWSTLNSQKIYADLGQYCVSLFSGRVMTRMGGWIKFSSCIRREIQNMARQNYVSSKVALIEGFGYTMADVISEHLGTDGKALISWRGRWWCSACPAHQRKVGQSTGENAEAERVLPVLGSPIFSA